MGELIEILRGKPSFYAEKGASAIQIEQAEQLLRLTFALDFKVCLREFGAVSVGGHELTGFSADKDLDIVEVTRKNRQRIDVAGNLYVIEEAHIDGIVIWQSETGEVFQSTQDGNITKISNSLIEYIEK